MPKSESTKKNSKQKKAESIVGIGASAGGLEALELFFDVVPLDTGAAYVVIQHLSPDFKSMMNELLARRTKLPICVAEEGMKVMANNIYLIPAKKEMSLIDGKLCLEDKETSQGISLPVNVFFESLALSMKEKAIGVILSGTGSDGSLGARAIYEAGGIVICQDPESSKFDGMPRAALKTGATALSLPPEKISEAVTDYINNPKEFRASSYLEDQDDPNRESDLLTLLKEEFGTDFKYYKSTTVNRRIERRITMSSFETIEKYVEHIKNSPEELSRLYRDLLIGVTKFFRDREAFDFIANKIIPDLVKQMSPTREIRVWSAGCASGEEPYSLAILFHEEALRQEKDVHLKIFATDLHSDSLDTASKGVYAPEMLTEVPKNQLDKYFVSHADGYQIAPPLRKSLVFTKHDVVKDPPFTKVDLITCRNMLIYFLADIQHRIISTFHFALAKDATLFLGPSETLGDLNTYFAPIEHHWKIFKRKAGNLPSVERLPNRNSQLTSTRDRLDTSRVSNQKVDQSLIKAYDAVLDRYVPGGFLIDDNRQLLHTFSDVGEFLKPKTGRYSSDLLDMLDDELKVAVATAIQRAKRESKPIHFKGVSLSSKNSPEEPTKLFNIWVEPLKEKDSPLTLVVIEHDKRASESIAPVEGQDISINEISRQRVGSLELELRYTKENLQATIEELETSNEEMQSTNEELVASNEELQSTNEELHSVNEELYTVNSEYQKKIEELTQLTNDMDNLLASTDIGTIFLDTELRIRKFTPTVQDAFNLLPTDIGRPIGHFTSSLDSPSLLKAIKTVLKTEEGSEQEVINRYGQPLLLRLRPYRINNEKVEGVVLSFVDIAKIKNAQERLIEKQSELEQFTATVAHDLKAPLRRVSQFSTFAKESLENNETEDLTEQLKNIDLCSGRMSSLIDDLLSYARMDGGDNTYEAVDLNSVIDDIKIKFEDTIESTNAKIEFHDLPKIQTDITGISHLFSNLISNSLKYADSKNPPNIKISCSESSKFYKFSVSDNGIGIDEDNFKAVFRPFKRFEGSDKCEGSGFGLSICKKVSTRLGGDIWLESKKGKGSTFHFTVPKAVKNLNQTITIAHLDDEKTEADLFQKYLGRSEIEDCSYEHCKTPSELDETLAIHEVDALFVDYDLKQTKNGIEVVENVRKTGFKGPIFLFSGVASSSLINEFLAVGGTDVLNKAEVNPEALSKLIKSHVRMPSK